MSKEPSIRSSLSPYLREQTARVEAALGEFLPLESQHPAALHEAMRYAVLNGGKRIRPLLTLAVCDMFQGDRAAAIIPACSVELIHCYSLIHDDLPFLDNDDFRRGKPTCHKKYGEAIALLAGDGLLALAFQILSRLRDEHKALRIVAELSQAAGTLGMVGGQAMELAQTNEEMDLPTLDAIHINKTGQLIKASCVAGAVTASASLEEENRIRKFGEYLGFAFQIVDDILDGDGYVRFMSVHEARGKVAEVIQKAEEQISRFKQNEPLLQLVRLILNRGQQEGSS